MSMSQDKSTWKTIVFHSIKDIRNEIRERKKRGFKIVIVPTMGNLHDGHAALIKTARSISENQIKVAVSIYVNPLQFNNLEDFKNYPSTWESDYEVCSSLQVDYIFKPTDREIYPDSADFRELCHVQPYRKYATDMEGASRPGHFAGMLTIVNKLFNIVEPNQAIFGKKDYQQLILVRKMTEDLNMDIEIIGLDTVRESNWLPLSSRNSRLSLVSKLVAAKVLSSTAKYVFERFKSRCFADSDSFLDLNDWIQNIMKLSQIEQHEEVIVEFDYLEARCMRHFNKLSICEGKLGCIDGCFDEERKNASKVIVLYSIIVNSVRLLDNIEVEFD